jgi:SOS response regulatory protein OraA/RecX
MQPAKKIKRDKTPEQAYAALIRLCARSEKSSGDALRLMQRWGVKPSARQGVLQKLLADRFIDDNRYAEAFVRDKIRLSGWGARKIRTSLRLKGIAAAIKKEYTPVLKHMTRTQGRVLLKLIDRETKYTAYEILREFRGGFVAGFWQSVSRIFGQNLKSEYDREGDDKVLEQIVLYYEAGLL